MKTGEEFVNSRPVPGSTIQYAPLLRCEKLKLIIEIDGPGHYNNINIQNVDIIKDKEFTDLGYHIARIPYFVSLTRNVLKSTIGIELSCLSTQKHGFFSNDVLPGNFNRLGYERFKQEMVLFDKVIEEDGLSVTQHIYKSLKAKAVNLESKGFPDQLIDIAIGRSSFQ